MQGKRDFADGIKVANQLTLHREVIRDFGGGLNIITWPLKVEEAGRTVDERDMPWKQRQEKFEAREGPNHSWLFSCT